MDFPNQDDIEALRAAVRGTVVQAGQDGYDEELSGFQAGLRHRPALVVGAAVADDVRVAVRFAAYNRLPVAVQSTGHGITVLDEGGLVISTKRLTDITVDPDGRRARIGAGARWQQVVAAAEPHGLIPPSGSAGHVGVAGYTLAGGMGLLARELGYAADHVRALDVVTADGDLRHITAETDPDLFWALRGGRDNFGVVTSLDIDLFPVDRIYGGGMFFSSEHVDAVLAYFRDWTATIPESMTASFGMIGYPDLPVFGEPLRGRHVTHIRFATTDLVRGPQLVAPWRAVAPVLIDEVGELPYREAGSIYREPDFAHAYDGNNVLLSDLPVAALKAIRDFAGPDAPVGCVVDLRHLGGALARPAAVPNAVSFRDARYILRVLSGFDPDTLPEVRRTHERLFDAVAPWVLGRSVGFIYGERGAGDFRTELYERPTLDRLRRLKTVYDPGNVFRRNQNIGPADGATA